MEIDLFQILYGVYDRIVSLIWEGDKNAVRFSDLVIAGLSGGLIVKFLDIIYLEIRRLFDKKNSARLFIDQHLDPLLKSADEVVGKLCALVHKDFNTMRDIVDQPNDNNDYVSLYYLLAKFWADVEIIRREGLSVAIAEEEVGRQYQTFINCLQSKNVRLVDRITQRAIGEILVKERNGKLETISFIEFFNLLETENHELKKWGKAVSDILSKTDHTTERQNLIKYGIVLHSMIDTLDKKHVVSKKRPSYPKKLSKKTYRELKFVVFRRYLTIVPNPKKYIERG